MEDVNFQGKTDPQILKESLENSGISKNTILQNVEKLKKSYLNHLETNIYKFNAKLLPGVNNLLKKLSEYQDVKIGLLTGNIKEGAQIKLNRFDLKKYFSFGAYGNDSAIRNELPAIAKNRIEKLFNKEIDYKNIFIIGDTVHDINCAKNSGSISIAVGTGWVEKEILMAEKPDFYLENLKDMDQILTIIKQI